MFAFLNVFRIFYVHVTFPEGVRVRKRGCKKWNCALYGTTQAPRTGRWISKKPHRSLGFTRFVADACLYYSRDSTLAELNFCYHDDLLMCSSHEKWKTSVGTVQKKFATHGLRLPAETLGAQAQKNKPRISLLIKKLGSKNNQNFNVTNANFSKMPISTGINLQPFKRGLETIVNSL